MEIVTFLNLIHNTVTKHLALSRNEHISGTPGNFENFPIQLLKFSVRFNQTDFVFFIPKVNNTLEQARGARCGGSG